MMKIGKNIYKYSDKRKMKSYDNIEITNRSNIISYDRSTSEPVRYADFARDLTTNDCVPTTAVEAAVAVATLESATFEAFVLNAVDIVNLSRLPLKKL